MDEPKMSRAEASRFRPGDVIAGKYRVEREIGRGGMGVVLAALHVDLDQRVAIKVLHRSAAESADFAARFAREARAAAKIKSEHVARIFDVGTLDDGTAYIVMELLEGEDLAGVLHRSGALPVHLAADYMIQICSAVAAAHAAGVVHRDLKPANLFLARNPDRSTTLKVLDFGVAKVTNKDGSPIPADDGSVTQTGHVFGSPTYMSPEQLTSAGRADTRADIWALGVVLFELLTNRPPFWHAAFAEIAAAVIRDPAPPLRDLLPDAPDELGAIIDRCLQKTPGKRYANVAALGRALASFGPPSAEAAVERMERLLGASEVTLDVPPSSDHGPRSVGTPAVSQSGDKRVPPGPRSDPSTGRRAARRDDNQATLDVSTVPQPAQPSSRRGAWPIGVAVLGVVIAAGLFLLRREPAPAPATSSAPSATAPATELTAPKSAPSATAAITAASAPLSPDVVLTIDGTPPETKVLLGAQVLGKAPGDVKVPRGSDRITLRFEAEGYVATEVKVVPTADRLLTLSLTRSASPAKSPARPKSPKDLETF
ncbi:MAG: serine/threonine-protein kinase [Byssovorax sp.]